MTKAFFMAVAALLALMSSTPAFAGQDLLVTGPARAAKLTFQVLDENQAAVSVTDAEGNPLLGLGMEDFTIRSGGKEAKILSVETVEARKDIRLNIVLVLDNSYSMKKRAAVRPLLNALEGFLRIVRPLDNVQVVVFDAKNTIDVNGRPMHVKILRSKTVGEIRNFLRAGYDEGLTDSTYLYEAMAAGIDLIDTMPDKKNRFLLVFSDGEDINSGIDRSVVTSMAKASGEFLAYAVDYMPTEKMDPFLLSFSEARGGTAWKAGSAEELIPIFKSFSTTLLYRYIITYRFSNPPSGTLSLEPAELDLDLLTTLDGSPVLNYVFFPRGEDRIPENYVRFTDRSQAASFDESGLNTPLERHLNVLNIAGRRLEENPSFRARIIGSNSGAGREKDNLNLSQNRALHVKQYLADVWGIDPSRLELGIRNLPPKPAPDEALGGPAENQRVEIVYEPEGLSRTAAEDFIVVRKKVTGVTVRPGITAEYGVATWQLNLMAGAKPVQSLSGTGELPTFWQFPFSDLGKESLSAFDSLQARIQVTDINGDTFETVSPAMSIRVSRRLLITALIGPPGGTLALEPESVVIEEVTAIDSSPLLNFVYFDTGLSAVPDRYVRFSGKEETLDFAEDRMKGTMEKHHQLLNIVGKRLRDHAEARVTLVGCNSGYGPESNNAKLSDGRATAVKTYLEEIWGIDPSRMAVRARNLPAVPSTGRVAEGRLENQRVEILSDTPAILDTVRSTYVEETVNVNELRILPQIQAGYGLFNWQIDVFGNGSVLHSFKGEGDLEPAYAVNLKDVGLKSIGACRELTAGFEVTDMRGEVYRDPSAASVPVRFVKKEERMAQKMGYRVVEKYALILFDFDSDAIKDRNRAVVDRILDRTKIHPSAKVKVIGHTDTIGKESYNMDLSERRAKAVYRQLLAAGAIAQTIDYAGAGPYDPPYDNGLAEGRALNRTVTVYLEYESME